MKRKIFKNIILLTIICIIFFIIFLNRYTLGLFSYKPLISVVVTSYNYEKYIKQTLDSILSQTYKNYEVIIVDDGSKDNSAELIKTYTEKYPNFHLYQHEKGINKGLPASLKLGVDKARGEYVAFLESDDYWDKNNLRERIKKLNEKKDIVILYNNLILFGNEDSIKVKQHYIDRIETHFYHKDFRWVKNTKKNPIPSFSSVMIKKSIMDKLDYNTPIPAYLDFWLYRQIFTDFPVYFIPQKLTYWRQHYESYNNDKLSKSRQKQLSIFIKKSDELIKKHSL